MPRVRWATRWPNSSVAVAIELSRQLPSGVEPQPAKRLRKISALCWAISIIHTRAHKWISTPFELVLWEVLLASAALTLLACVFEGIPQVRWSMRLALLLAYGSVVSVALAYWAMAMVNRSLPAMTTSLGVLATPVVGLLCSMVVLGEDFSLALLVGLALIIGGIVLGIAWRGRGEA